MQINSLRILRLTLWILVFVFLLQLADENVEGRKRNRKNKNLQKSIHHSKRRHHRRRSEPPKHDDVMSDQERFIKIFQVEKLRPLRPAVNRHPVIAVEESEYREAHICIHSKGELPLHRSVGRLGYHSKDANVVGKLIHIRDPNMRTHYGCNEHIGNKHEIPRNVPWIALIERGECYFFNKIRLAKMHNASAAVIYTHREKLDVMNTAGTNITAMMISRSDGRKIIELLDSNVDVEMSINTQNDMCSKLPKATRTSSTPTDKPSQFNVTHNLISNVNKNDSGLLFKAVTTLSPLETTSGVPSLRTSQSCFLFFGVLTLAMLTS